MAAKKNPHFDNKFLAQIKEILLQEETRLENEINKFAKPNPNVDGDFDANVPEYGTSEDENAREVADYAVNKSLEVTLEKDLRDVKKALARLEDGTYGICKYTNEPINQKRLLARPTSSSSVGAKKLLTNEQ